MTKPIDYPIRSTTPPVFPPKARKGRPATWKPRLDALRPYPGEWLLFPNVSDPTTMASRINRGVVKGATPGEFEARTLDKELWVRYVGDETQAPSPRQSALHAIDTLFDQWPADIPAGLQDAVKSAIQPYLSGDE